MVSRKLVNFQSWCELSLQVQSQCHSLAYLDDVHGAHDIGVKRIPHVLSGALQQGGFAQNSCVVNQQVETPGPHQGVHLPGALFNATQVSGICRREKEKCRRGAVRAADKYRSTNQKAMHV